MTFVEFVNSWTFTLEPDEWKIVLLVMWLMFCALLIK